MLKSVFKKKVKINLTLELKTVYVYFRYVCILLVQHEIVSDYTYIFFMYLHNNSVGQQTPSYSIAYQNTVLCTF